MFNIEHYFIILQNDPFYDREFRMIFSLVWKLPHGLGIDVKLIYLAYGKNGKNYILLHFQHFYVEDAKEIFDLFPLNIFHLGDAGESFIFLFDMIST